MAYAWVYIYTDKTREKSNQYKLGITTRESPLTRVREQEKTSNPDPHKLLYSINTHDYLPDGKDIFDLEKYIHKKLTNSGYHYNKEWFNIPFDKLLELVIDYIETFCGNSDVSKKEMSLMPHQKDAFDVIKRWWNGSDLLSFLLYLKARGGKTYIILFFIRLIQPKNIIIFNSFPILNSQWIDIIEEHTGFSDYNIIDYSNSKKTPVLGKKNIIFMSTQDAKGNGILNKDKHEAVLDIDFDLAIIDESHIGIETEKGQSLLDKIKYKRRIYLSATPNKNILSGEFNQENTFTYTLSDEKKYKNLYPEVYKNYPDITFISRDIHKEDKEVLKNFPIEEQFKFEKFFEVNDKGKFKYKESIIYLFKRLIGSRDVCKYDSLKTEYPLKNEKRFSGVDSILMFLPTIKSTEALKELLNNIPEFDLFDIHVTNSTINSSDKLYYNIKNVYNPKPGRRSIILAVDQLTTGITLGYCSMVIHLNDGKSMDRYIQASFRCQTPSEDKDECFVLDLNPARSSEIHSDYMFSSGLYQDKPINEIAYEYFENVNIFNQIGDEFVKLDFMDFYNRTLDSMSNYTKFSVRFIKLDKINDPKIIDIASKFTISNIANKSKSISLLETPIDEGKVKKSIIKKEKENGKEEENKEANIMVIIKLLLDKTISLPLYSRIKYDNIEDCFKHFDDNEKDRVEYINYIHTISQNTNISYQDIKYIYLNIFTQEDINTVLKRFREQWILIYSNKENEELYFTMLKKLIELIDLYLKPSDTEKRLLGEVFTPLYDSPGSVEEQLNLMDKSFWSNKNVKVLDPCCGIGNYPIVLLEKFMRGLKEEFPDWRERLKYILENIIYINEYQSKNLFIYLLLLDPDNQYNLNYIKGDYLELDIKETFGVDKFDLITTNPPYNEARGNNNASRDIYDKMVEKAQKEADNVIMIIPSRWFIKTSLSKFRNNMLNKFGMKTIKHFDDNRFFDNADIKGGVCYFHFKKGYKGDILFNDNILNIDDLDIIPNDLSKETFSIISKVVNKKNIQHLFNSKGHFNIKTNDVRLSDSGDIKCYVSKQKGGIKYLPNLDFSDKNIDKWKLAIPSAAGKGGIHEDFYNRIEIIKPGDVCSESFIFFDFDTEEELFNFKSYLTSDIFSFLVRLRKIKQDVTSDVFKWVPNIPLDHQWTNDELFDYFSIEEDEIKLIKKYTG